MKITAEQMNQYADLDRITIKGPVVLVDGTDQKRRYSKLEVITPHGNKPELQELTPSEKYGATRLLDVSDDTNVNVIRIRDALVLEGLDDDDDALAFAELYAYTETDLSDLETNEHFKMLPVAVAELLFSGEGNINAIEGETVEPQLLLGAGIIAAKARVAMARQAEYKSKKNGKQFDYKDADERPLGIDEDTEFMAVGQTTVTGNTVGMIAALNNGKAELRTYNGVRVMHEVGATYEVRPLEKREAEEIAKMAQGTFKPTHALMFKNAGTFIASKGGVPGIGVGPSFPVLVEAEYQTSEDLAWAPRKVFEVFNYQNVPAYRKGPPDTQAMKDLAELARLYQNAPVTLPM